MYPPPGFPLLCFSKTSVSLFHPISHTQHTVQNPLVHLQINRLGMPVKRSRIGSSSSHQAMQIETTAAAAVNPAMVTNADAAGEPSRLSMWTIGYPVSAGEYDQPRIGEFLERCYYCRKRIAENADVFMYSNLCAFCSTECRNLQIALDHSAKVAPDNPKGTMTHRQ